MNDITVVGTTYFEGVDLFAGFDTGHLDGAVGQDTVGDN